ncbi:hypothetical protein GYMLUDRAFT_64504 [Collybiopsis luxurians FD-317 M1]|uniref:Uncharacterized protein n=1 Tax=Collybiopsis luxurians FD-317 M1 TaxID=944289 RepID=A0A0D0AP15_9AGAR|nr:hypothetical protein GYMLUDRAFT_64504 [Collybiopsis luxurians FD-317 M1]
MSFDAHRNTGPSLQVSLPTEISSSRSRSLVFVYGMILAYWDHLSRADSLYTLKIRWRFICSEIAVILTLLSLLSEIIFYSQNGTLAFGATKPKIYFCVGYHRTWRRLYDQPSFDCAPFAALALVPSSPMQLTSPNQSAASVRLDEGQIPSLSHVPSKAKEILTFVRPATEKDEKDRHALVALPRTYNEAVAAAIQTLGRYMGDATPENVILRCHIQDSEKKWIWADIHPENWQLIVSSGDNVGVFERLKIPRGMENFIQGKVYLSFGARKPCRMEWSAVTGIMLSREPDARTLVRRPSSFKDAIELLRAATSNQREANYPFERPSQWYAAHSHVQDWTDEDWAKAAQKVKFYHFTDPGLSTVLYLQFPTLAYTNDDLWRYIVPMPGHVLGVALPKKEEL